MTQKVWVVKNGPLEANVASQSLAGNFACELFSDGTSVLARLAAGDAPDALVVACQPVASAVELCKQVRSTRDELLLPIILIQDGKAEPDRVGGLAAGANDCLTSPYQAAELVARVQKLCRIKHLHERALVLEKAEAEAARLREQAERLAAESLQKEADRAMRDAHRIAEVENQKVESLFNQSLVAVAVLEGPRHTFTFANPAYRAMVGGADVVGKPLLDALPELRTQGFAELLDKVVATSEAFVGQEVPVKLAHHREGEFLYVNVSYQPKRNVEGQVDGVVTSAVDVTEQVLSRRRVEAAAAALRVSEERQRRVLDASGAGLWDLDAATGEIAADRRLVELMGLPPRSTFTLSLALEAVHAEDREQVSAAVNAALAGENGGRYLTEFRTGGRGDVPLRWVESRAAVIFGEDGKALRLAGAMIDITARKQAEYEREGMLQALASQPLLRVCVLKGPQLVYQMANAAHVEHVAYGRDVLGRPILEALPELKGQGFDVLLRQVIETGVSYVTSEAPALLDRGDGVLEKRYFSFVYQPVRGDRGTFDSVLAMGQDVTSAVQARLDLQASQARLREMFELAPAAICLLEGPEHRFVLANNLYRQLVGGREVVGKSLAEALPEVVEQGFVALLDEVRRTGKSYVGNETWLNLRRSEDAPLEEVCLNFVYQPVSGPRGEHDSIFVHAVDVTESVRARQSAQRLAAERQAAYDVLEHGDPVVMLDSEWRFTFANASWAELAQVRREDVMGRSHWDVFPATTDKSRKYFEGYHRAMRERVPVQLTDYYAPLDLWTAVSLYPTADGGLVLFIRNVSAEKKAEAEAQSRADFERQLIGIVSHDLRNPLSTIIMGTQLLMLEDSLAPLMLKTLLRIQSAGERGVRMVRDLLDFTQVRAGIGIPVSLTSGNLHTVVNQAVDDAATTHPDRSIYITTSGDGHGQYDLDRLSQVVNNLLSNALKYSEPGSAVNVRCESNDEGVTVSVHNIGVPIAAEALTRIFLPMQRATSQLTNTARSVGLGLFIVKHIVEAHSGRVWVTSTAETGTIFTFWVPKYRPAAS